MCLSIYHVSSRGREFTIFLKSPYSRVSSHVIIYFNYSCFWSLRASKCSVSCHGNQRTVCQVLSIFPVQNPPVDLTINDRRPRLKLGWAPNVTQWSPESQNITLGSIQPGECGDQARGRWATTNHLHTSTLHTSTMDPVGRLFLHP